MAVPLLVPTGPVTVTACSTAGYSDNAPGDIGLGTALATGNVITFACNPAHSGGPGPYTIVPPATITIAAGTVSIDGLDGGARDITLSGNNAEVVLRVNTGATLSLANIQIAFGKTTSGRAGGVQVAGGTLNVTNSTFHDNAGAFGGAIDGGGFQFPCGAAITVTDSTFFNNNSLAGGNGGAFESCALSVLVANSTFVANHANGTGGALNLFNLNNSPVGTLINDTFSGNLANNTVGGALGSEGASYSITNSIVANNTAVGVPNGCANGRFITPITDGGHNLEFPSNTCGFSAAKGDVFGNPNLGPLANNGGPTQTEALLAGSAAIGHGLAAVCLTLPGGDFDQRGMPRFSALRGACDIGAYDSGGVIAEVGVIVAPGPLSRVGFAASQNPAFNVGYITGQYGANTFVVRQPVVVTPAEACPTVPCKATLTLSGTMSSVQGPLFAVGDQVQWVLTVQATAAPAFSQTFVSEELKVTTSLGAPVLDVTVPAPFAFGSKVTISAT